MVARRFPDAPTLLTRREGAVTGFFSAVAPAALPLIFLGPYTPLALTLAVSCLGSGVIVGSTIGRGLAARPDPLGVLIVAASAVVVGAVLAAPIVALGDSSGDLPGTFFVGLVAFGIPAYFLLAIPGVVTAITLAQSRPGATR